MTIHKSQGSEFDNVLVVLPDRWNMVMTRELLYTAVTRARKGVIIAAGSDIVREMILTPTRRMSGLKERLWGAI
jgi:exodeoxyribonuclease V alpha subunit